MVSRKSLLGKAATASKRRAESQCAVAEAHRLPRHVPPRPRRVCAMEQPGQTVQRLTEYRASDLERQRTADLLRLTPASGAIALDIGARDGHFSLLLAQRFQQVIALDLTMPSVDHPRVVCVQGDAAALPYDDNSIDFVFCAEVLEHIPSPTLILVCQEIERVSAGHILIGVPYRQDIRVNRTTCYSCMGKNPPWGHVNSFDEARLRELFPTCAIEAVSFVGSGSLERTNALSCLLMDWAGNPYGTYSQDEPCIHCGHPLTEPPARGIGARILTKFAFWSRRATEVLARPGHNWMHVLLTKTAQQNGESVPTSPIAGRHG